MPAKPSGGLVDSFLRVGGLSKHIVETGFTIPLSDGAASAPAVRCSPSHEVVHRWALAPGRLAKPHIQHHHDDEAAYEAKRRNVCRSIKLGLGNDLLDNNVDHRACSEGERIWKHGMNVENR